MRTTKITIKFFAALRDITGKREEKMELEKTKTTLRDVLRRLSTQYGKDFSGYVFEEPGQDSIKQQISLMVNGQSLRNS